MIFLLLSLPTEKVNSYPVSFFCKLKELGIKVT